MNNKGLNWVKELSEQSSEDWSLGATGLTCMAEIPEEEREKYLPKGELQFGREDFMDCASRAPLNILEMKFNYLFRNKKLSWGNEIWLREKGYLNSKDEIEFSDRFVAINSGTTKEGNSLKAPLDAIRKQGLIPKNLLPAENWMDWNEYHNPESITENMRKLGLEFSQRFFINYERGKEKDFDRTLKKDLLIVGAFAWPRAIDGEYPRVEGNPNHAFVIFKRPKYFIFDNYEEIKDDFIKKLASNYDFLETGYRILINKESVVPLKKNPFQKFLDLLKNYFREIFV